MRRVVNGMIIGALAGATILRLLFDPQLFLTTSGLLEWTLTGAFGGLFIFWATKD